MAEKRVHAESSRRKKRKVGDERDCARGKQMAHVFRRRWDKVGRPAGPTKTGSVCRRRLTRAMYVISRFKKNISH